MNKRFGQMIACLEKAYWDFRCYIYYLLKVRTKQIRFLHNHGREEKNKKFLILYCQDPKFGAITMVQHFILLCKYACESGYIPIIDMQNCENAMSNDNSVNAWELYFLQPGGYTLEKAKRCKNIRYITRHEISYAKKKYEITQEDIEKYVKPNDKLNNLIDFYWEKLQLNSEDTIGVIARGTDYLNEANHAKVIEITSFIKSIKHNLANRAETKVFLATEDASFKELLLKAFGGRVLMVDDANTIYHGECQFIIDLWKASDIDIVDKNYKYLVSVYILTRLKFIMSNTWCGAASFCKKYKSIEVVVDE